MKQKAMILQSSEGQEYVIAVLVPKNWSAHAARRRFLTIKAKVCRAKPDEWTWPDDLEPLLIKAGFEVPEQFHGPIWD